jgi:hypothetical protein
MKVNSLNELIKRDEPWFDISVPKGQVEAAILKIRMRTGWEKVLAVAIKIITLEGLLVFALSSIAL